MLTEPKIEQHDAQPYLSIHASVTMPEMATIVPALFPELLNWLTTHGVERKGAPFIRYVVVDMENKLDVEVGAPVASAQAGDGRVQPGTIPGGRYATCLHTGPYKNLEAATATLLAWAENQNISWKMSKNAQGQPIWEGRFEFYLTNPDEEPDAEKWETILAFLIADGSDA